MQITGPQPPVSGQQHTNSSPSATNFRVGQVLQALAQGTSPEGLVKLQIGRDTMLARSQLPLAPGQNLTLQVERAGNTPELRIIPAPSAPLNKADALRDILPRMLAVTPGIVQLLKSASPGAASSLPAELEQTVRQLVDKLPNSRQLLSADGLRSAVEQSGLFSEARLAKQQVPAADLKTALLRVAAQLRLATAALPPATGSKPATEPALPTQAGRTQTASPAAPANSTSLAQSASQSRTSTHGAAHGVETQTSARTNPAATTNAATAYSKMIQYGTNTTRSRTAGAIQPNPGSGATPNTPPGKAPAPAPTQNLEIASKLNQETVSAIAPRIGSGVAAPTPDKAAVIIRPALSAATTAPSSNAATATAFTAVSMAAGLNVSAKPTKGRSRTMPIQPAQIAAADLSSQHLHKLSRQVEGALARVQYQQLASLPQEDSNRQVWQLELPIRNEQRLNEIKLRIEEERHSRGGKEEDSNWRIDLAFNLEPLGPLQVRVGLQGEKVSSVFWAQREQAAALIDKRLEELRLSLERVGLEVGELAARKGQAPAPPNDITGPVLDERA